MFLSHGCFSLSLKRKKKSIKNIFKHISFYTTIWAHSPEVVAWFHVIPFTQRCEGEALDPSSGSASAWLGDLFELLCPHQQNEENNWTYRIGLFWWLHKNV